jgi:hypothetical protein
MKHKLFWLSGIALALAYVSCENPYYGGGGGPHIA